MKYSQIIVLVVVAACTISAAPLTFSTPALVGPGKHEKGKLARVYPRAPGSEYIGDGGVIRSRRDPSSDDILVRRADFPSNASRNSTSRPTILIHPADSSMRPYLYDGDDIGESSNQGQATAQFDANQSAHVPSNSNSNDYPQPNQHATPSFNQQTFQNPQNGDSNQYSPMDEDPQLDQSQQINQYPHQYHHSEQNPQSHHWDSNQPSQTAINPQSYQNTQLSPPYTMAGPVYAHHPARTARRPPQYSRPRPTDPDDFIEEIEGRKRKRRPNDDRN